MAFTKRQFVDGETPLNKDLFDHLQNGIADLDAEVTNLGLRVGFLETVDLVLGEDGRLYVSIAGIPVGSGVELQGGNGGSGGDSSIPTYYYTETARVINLIEAFKAAHPNHFIFGAVSDIHISSGETTAENTKKSIQHAAYALEVVGSAVGCDFIANLGDNCEEGHIDPSMTTDARPCGLENAEYAINTLKPAFDKLVSFNLVGNHDKSDHTSDQYNLIGVHNDFDVASTTTIRGFGYKDYTDKKVRVIVLNTCDYLNASGGCALSYEQKDFLMRALDLTTTYGDDAREWQILLLSHIPLDWYTEYNSNDGAYNFYTDLQAILNAYEDGTKASITVNLSYALNETPSNYATYSSGNLVYNYSLSDKKAKIIANIHGHLHNNKVGKIANTNIARVSTANTSPYGNSTNKYAAYGDYVVDKTIAKVSGTAKDTAATFYCIDLDEQIIYAYGYGADVDRVVSFKDAPVYTVTRNIPDDVTSSNTSDVVAEGASYTTTLSAASGYAINTVKVTMGGVDITSTAYSNGVINIANVTGNIVITATAKVVTSYTNIIDSVGTVDNVRLRASNGATQAGDAFVSNYFPVKGGDIIRVYFPNGNRASIPTNCAYCCLYTNASGTWICSYDSSTSSTVLKNATTTGYEIHIPSDNNCSYARVAGGPNGASAGWIVTVNEEIK